MWRVWWGCPSEYDEDYNGKSKELSYSRKALFDELDDEEFDAMKTKWKKEGAKVLMFDGQKAKPRETTLAVDFETQEIKSNGKSKKGKKNIIDLFTVEEISRGLGKNHLERITETPSKKTLDKDLDARSISIKYYKGDKVMWLEFVWIDDEKEFEPMMGALHRHLNETMNVEKENGNFKKYVTEQFELADTDGDGRLCFGEIMQIVDSLNMKGNEQVAASVFRKVDVDESGDLDRQEFEEFLNIIMYRPENRPEIAFLFTRISDHDIGVTPPPSGWLELDPSKNGYNSRINCSGKKMPTENFVYFQKEIQKDSYDEEACMTRLEDITGSTIDWTEGIDYATFMRYLSCDENEVFDPLRGKEVREEEMHEPLTDYWIASSHNTYLEGNQLTSKSSVKRYRSDLCNGCRCVELDCWDGSNNEPIVTHGNTATTDISFKDCIEEIRKYAFKPPASEYPVILSLENHCSGPQQEVMATVMNEILGEDNIVKWDGLTELPSPYSLRYKFVLKGKILKSKTDEDEDEEDEEDEDEDEEEVMASKDESPMLSLSKLQQKMGSLETKMNHTKMSDYDKDTNDHEKKKMKGKQLSVKADPEKKKKKEKTHPDLSRITFLAGIKFPSFEVYRDKSPNTMSSFTESKIKKLIDHDMNGCVYYNRNHLSRIYPAGTRIASDNYDPIPAWCVGCQIVALNYQTGCKEMQLNQGKFADNGGCGYILKPDFLIREGGDPFASPKVLKITILSGEKKKPRRPFRNSTQRHMNPFVEVELRGTTSPSSLEFYSAKKTTKPKRDNGFISVWNETMSFEVDCPALCMVHFTVIDKNLGAEGKATRAISFDCIRPGIRNVSLRDWFGNSLDKKSDFFGCCSLLCRFDILDKE